MTHAYLYITNILDFYIRRATMATGVTGFRGNYRVTPQRTSLCAKVTNALFTAVKALCIYTVVTSQGTSAATIKKPPCKPGDGCISLPDIPNGLEFLNDLSNMYGAIAASKDNKGPWSPDTIALAGSFGIVEKYGTDSQKKEAKKAREATKSFVERPKPNKDASLKDHLAGLRDSLQDLKTIAQSYSEMQNLDPTGEEKKDL